MARYCSRFCLALLCALFSGQVGQAQSWSPDAQRIALGGSSLLLADVGTTVPGSHINLVTIPEAGAAIEPIWSPDGHTIAYLTADQKITLLDVTTRQHRDLVNRAASPVVWAPGGSRFGVVNFNEEGGLVARTVHSDGGTALAVDLPFHRLAPLGPALAWVPNTDNMILAGGEDDRVDLYLIDQGQVVRLTSSGDILGFAVSADGSRVIWVRRSPNTRYILLSIFSMTIDTRTVQRVDFPNTVPSINPNPRHAPEAVLFAVFAPDLNHFAFVTQGGPGGGPQDTALYVSDLTGKSIRLIGRGKAAAKPAAADAAVAPGTTGLAFPALWPSFSPDSRQLAVVRSEGAKRFLLVQDLNSAARRTVSLP